MYFLLLFSCFAPLQKPKSTVRFFDRNEFYSVHAEDADFTAKSVLKSTNVIKYMPSKASGGADLAYVILSKNQFESWVRELLLVLHYRVEVYVLRASTQKSAQDWMLEYRGSPGNLVQFEELLFTNRDMVASSSLIAVYLKSENQQRVSKKEDLSQNKHLSLKNQLNGG